jgi:beta-lactamase regulating signal transducer with metallopeptidase domain
MAWLVEAAVSNAVLTLPFALCALAVWRLRRPALSHAVWVVVLLKLITPPLLTLPVPFPILAADVLWTSWNWTASTVALPVVLALWVTGTLACFTWSLLQLRRFGRRLRSAVPATPELAARGRRLAHALGLSRAPRILVLPEPVSPLLWGCGRRACIVVPAELLRRMSRDEVDALLLHELAHYRRGDHWVRLLELVVTVIFWWHPIVWLARREIARTEEECCDGWVVCRSSGSPRHYAAAILTTLDFLSERSGAVPLAATGVGGMPLLERRLRQIMHHQSPPPLSPALRALVVGLACLLPLQPRALSTPADSTRSGERHNPSEDAATAERLIAVR